MHKKEMVDGMLGKIEQAIVRILHNFQTVDSYHYYLLTPEGMERLERGDGNAGHHSPSLF